MGKIFKLRKRDEIQIRVIIAACNDRLKKLTLKFGGKKKHTTENQAWYQMWQDETDLLIRTIERLEETLNLK